MEDLSAWTPRPTPTNAPMSGCYFAIHPFDAESHCLALWEAFGGERTNEYLFHFGWPKMTSWRDLAGELEPRNQSGAFVTCVFCDRETGVPMGMANYMRIDEKNGVVEVGAVAHGAPMARSRAATEAHYLMARRVFDELGYRRYEWKLNNANEASHRAARRFGFVFEGIFRQAEVKPYGNRDTAWYSLIDKDWPAVRLAFETWLAPENFDGHGGQLMSLSSLTARTLATGDLRLVRAGSDSRTMVEEFQAKAYRRTREAIGGEPMPLEWDYGDIFAQCEVWLASRSEKLVGVLILRPRPGDLYLESIATAPEAAGTGLGAAMMTAATERARALARPAVRLVTNTRNPAQDWYRRVGFEEEREEVLSDRKALHMVLRL
ncbi:GNAT family N-acetyltransferase [Oricola cellulosilytica]|uniref:GNAT family N-acetyltransferase n=1 Tax=Oricola cellulosilytica TaxID=1429082 RepID=A0A4R0P3E1_9HYPH|nr:GNAT family N-acetyltransferase [Oricola cellulosilytica]TCD11370.1 GNAT family N-acetyltransferase [Oricola cellulosilytica]